MLIIIGIIIAVLVIFITKQPEDFVVSRSISINAPATTIFEHVNDLHKWEAWSPWAKLDPNAKRSFEGPSAGVGAIMHWEGNNKVGAGSMTIQESRPAEYIKFQLDFLRPFKTTNNSEFLFKQEENQTLVTWSLQGKKNFISKAMHLILNCNKMIGDQYEKGLANLKALAEK